MCLSVCLSLREYEWKEEAKTLATKRRKEVTDAFIFDRPAVNSKVKDVCLYRSTHLHQVLRDLMRCNRLGGRAENLLASLFGLCDVDWFSRSTFCKWEHLPHTPDIHAAQKKGLYPCQPLVSTHEAAAFFQHQAIIATLEEVSSVAGTTVPQTSGRQKKESRTRRHLNSLFRICCL